MLAKIPIKGHSETTHEAIFLEGDLHIPQNSGGLVVFVHGSGSGRLSPRNQSVAEKLNKDGLATLLFDLLTISEEKIEELNIYSTQSIGVSTLTLLQMEYEPSFCLLTCHIFHRLILNRLGHNSS